MTDKTTDLKAEIERLETDIGNMALDATHHGGAQHEALARMNEDLWTKKKLLAELDGHPIADPAPADADAGLVDRNPPAPQGEAKPVHKAKK